MRQKQCFRVAFPKLLTKDHENSSLTEAILLQMIRDMQSKTDSDAKPRPHGHSHDKAHAAQTSAADNDDSVQDFSLHCDELTFRELEFRLVSADHEVRECTSDF